MSCWAPDCWRATPSSAGLKVKPWVKTSLAPGSQVVTDYLARSKLDKPLAQLGFNLVGYGCTTCIGNSGPLPDDVSKAVNDGDLVVAAVLSGNRNFEGRVHQQVRANYLASPMLVVCLRPRRQDERRSHQGADRLRQEEQAGLPERDLAQPEGDRGHGAQIAVTPAMFRSRYADVFSGGAPWKKIKVDAGKTYRWDDQLDLCEEPALLRGHADRARAHHRHQGRTHPRHLRRLDHHRPHQSGGLDQEGFAGRQISHGARRSAGGLQFLRRAARQS